LVGNYQSILRIRFVLTAVGVGHPVQPEARNTDDLLALSDEQGQKKCGSPTGDVRGPAHFLAYFAGNRDELENLVLQRCPQPSISEAFQRGL
jgi:hypothetical protein